MGSRESGTGGLSIFEKDAAPVVSFAAVIERPDDRRDEREPEGDLNVRHGRAGCDSVSRRSIPAALYVVAV